MEGKVAYPKYKILSGSTVVESLSVNPLFILPFPTLGFGRNDRVGRKVKFVRCQIRAMFYTNQSFTYTPNVTVPPFICRMLVVVQHRYWQEIENLPPNPLEDDRAMAFQDPNLFDVQTILYDETIGLGGYMRALNQTLTTARDTCHFEDQHKMVFVDFEMDVDTVFKDQSDTPARSNQIFFMFQSNRPSDATSASVYFAWRLHFLDN